MMAAQPSSVSFTSSKGKIVNQAQLKGMPYKSTSSFSQIGNSMTMSLDKFRSAGSFKVPSFLPPRIAPPRSLVTVMAAKQEAEAEDNYYSHIEMAPPDAILKLSVGYKADTNPKKVNLGIGAYRDENGSPYVFPVV